MKFKIKNKHSNHTGLAGMNLGLANQISMRKYLKSIGEWDEWQSDINLGFSTKNLIKYLITGWFGKNSLRKCRIVKC